MSTKCRNLPDGYVIYSRAPIASHKGFSACYNNKTTTENGQASLRYSYLSTFPLANVHRAPISRRHRPWNRIKSLNDETNIYCKLTKHIITLAVHNLQMHACIQVARSMELFDYFRYRTIITIIVRTQFHDKQILHDLYESIVEKEKTRKNVFDDDNWIRRKPLSCVNVIFYDFSPRKWPYDFAGINRITAMTSSHAHGADRITTACITQRTTAGRRAQTCVTYTFWNHIKTLQVHFY